MPSERTLRQGGQRQGGQVRGTVREGTVRVDSAGKQVRGKQVRGKQVRGKQVRGKQVREGGQSPKRRHRVTKYQIHTIRKTAPPPPMHAQPRVCGDGFSVMLDGALGS
jgi:hypothetical protein